VRPGVKLTAVNCALAIPPIFVELISTLVSYPKPSIFRVVHICTWMRQCDLYMYMDGRWYYWKLQLDGSEMRGIDTDS
jgi:hypothetical protein